MPSLVSRADLESLLDAIARETADTRAGIFGPGSIVWQINRESAVFLGAGRAALLQIAHPWVAAALAQHSSLLGDPIARFHNTFRVVYTMVFGTLGQALTAARRLHTLHMGIQGELPEHVAAWPPGAHYEANEIDALRWVYATLVESAILAYEWVLPLGANQREEYYQQSRIMAALFGIPAAALPADWSAFAAYTGEMMTRSGALGVSPASRSLAQAVLSGAGSWIHPPRWYRALTAAWIPEPLRDAFGLCVDNRATNRARRWLPRFYGALPGSARFVGPYHEALARLRGRNPGLVARANNRFWIGQAALPFSEE
ncbi:MAG TPA: oxygenase MpaB family protein [Acidobacteriaceae bacterium]